MSIIGPQPSGGGGGGGGLALGTTSLTATPGDVGAATAGSYHQLGAAAVFLGSAVAANTKVFGEGTFVNSGTAQNGSAVLLMPFAHADYDVPGRTTRVRLRGYVATNTIAPAINFTFNLASVAFGGAAASISTTTTAITGVNVVLTAPVASTYTSGVVEVDLTNIPDGVYAVNVVTSGTTATNSATIVGFRLSVHTS